MIWIMQINFKGEKYIYSQQGGQWSFSYPWVTKRSLKDENQLNFKHLTIALWCKLLLSILNYP